MIILNNTVLFFNLLFATRRCLYLILCYYFFFIHCINFFLFFIFFFLFNNLFSLPPPYPTTYTPLLLCSNMLASCTMFWNIYHGTTTNTRCTCNEFGSQILCKELAAFWHGTRELERLLLITANTVSILSQLNRPVRDCPKRTVIRKYLLLKKLERWVRMLCWVCTHILAIDLINV